MNMNELSRNEVLEILKKAQKMLAVADNNEATIRHLEQEIEDKKLEIRSQYSPMSNLVGIFKVIKAGIMKYINKLLAIYKREDPSETIATLPQVDSVVLKKARRIYRSVLIGLIAGLILGILFQNIIGCLSSALIIAILIGIIINWISFDEEIEKEIEEQIRPMQQELEMLVTENLNYENSKEMGEMRECIVEAYFNTSAVERLISYFESYRADTYKEAVNLYEQGDEKMRLENSNKEFNADFKGSQDTKAFDGYNMPKSSFSAASGNNLHYVVMQVTLKEKLFGTGSGNLIELENVINAQARKGYRLHTITTSNGGSKGIGGGDRIQATLVFEKI